MSFQMIRVISSPSISTTGFVTLIFAIELGAFSRRQGRPGEPRPGVLWRGAAAPARLITALVERLAGDYEIDTTVEQCLEALARPVDDWFLVYGEGCVHEHGQSGGVLETRQDVVIERIASALDDLWARRAVHVHHSGNALAPGGMNVAGDGHVAAGAGVDGRYV